MWFVIVDTVSKQIIAESIVDTESADDILAVISQIPKNIIIRSVTFDIIKKKQKLIEGIMKRQQEEPEIVPEIFQDNFHVIKVGLVRAGT